MRTFPLLLAVLAACDSLGDTPEDQCRACDPAFEYCVRFASDIAGEPDGFGCRDMPAACSDDIACSCLVDEGEPCADFACQALVTGPLMVTCPGG